MGEHRSIESLLAGGASPEEFALQLFLLNVEQARASDPELATLLWACAIPRSFDAEVIGALREAPDDAARNGQLLDALIQFSFVLARADGGYVYHDNTRDAALAEWLRPERRAEYGRLRGLLAAFFRARGIRSAEEQRYAAALPDFGEAIALEPESAEGYDLRGRALFAQRDYAAALEDFTRAIALQPEQGNYHWWRGLSHHQQGDYAAALEDFTRAIALQPEDGINYWGRGRSYYARGDYAAAAEDFTRAIALQPDYDGNYWRRGWSRYAQGDYDAAVADFARAIALQPEDGHNYWARGRSYYARGEYAAALADFTRALELRPQDADTYFWRGLARLAARGDGALADFTRALELRPQDGQSYFWRGVAHRLAGNAEAAAADHARAAALAAEAGGCLRPRLLANLALLDGDAGAAREHYAHALGGACARDRLLGELDYLQLLAHLLPAREDIRATAAWFAEQLGIS